jgi:hypothetical protein
MTDDINLMGSFDMSSSANAIKFLPAPFQSTQRCYSISKCCGVFCPITIVLRSTHCDNGPVSNPIRLKW